jgi:hypothetical protein
MKNVSHERLMFGWGAIIFIASLRFILSNDAAAATYYFSTINGSDSNTGTSVNSPWESLSKMQSTINNLKAGDILYLERGSVWYMTDLNFLNLSGTSTKPIRIKAYGTGNMPVLSGEKLLSGPIKSGDVYTFYDNDLPDVLLTTESYGRRYLGSVTIDGKHYATSRYPNGNSYLQSTSAGSTTITDNTSWSTDQWKDGFAAVKNVKWQWSSVKILSNTSNVLTTSPHVTTNSIGSPSGECFYYILNAYNAMDIPGEWAYKNNQLSIYWPGTLGSVRASVSDTIVNIKESNYLYFDSIYFRGSNFYGVKITEGDYNKFNYCKFSGMGENGIYVFGKYAAPPDPGDSEGNEVRNCEFSDVLLCSVFYRCSRGGRISNNYIHRNAIDNGYHNLMKDFEANPVHGYGIAVFNNLAGNPIINRNFIDSTAAGIITHFNAYSIYIRENFIRNYGMSEISDIAAFYLVSDTYASALKIFRRNMILDGHTPQGTMYNQYTDSYTHAVYFDQDSYSVKGDSNSIENTSAALCTNGGKYRSFKYNNILNPNAHGMHYAHANAIYHSYQVPLMNGTLAESDTIMHNNYVFGSIPTKGYAFWRKGSVYGSAFPINSVNNYEKYFDPYSGSPEIILIYDQYDVQYSYDIEEWRAATFYTNGVTYNPGSQSTYNNTPYTVIKLMKNFSAKSKSFPLSAKYVDVNGTVVEGSVTVPPFYSKLLFRTEGDASLDNDIFIDSTLIPSLGSVTQLTEEEEEGVNYPPSFGAAHFTVDQADEFSYTIGTLSASDPDDGQSLYFSITAGNSSGYFSVSNKGTLSFTTNGISFAGNPEYNLTVRVTDNGEPSLYAQANVKVSLTEDETLVVDNHSPVIQPQTFMTSFDADVPSKIGSIIASDVDQGQSLTFSISSGNIDNLFSMNSSSGELGLVQLPSNQVPVTYQLVVKVEDDDNSPLSASAPVTVYISASTIVYYIDPNNEGDALADGSYNHPFPSWSQVTWEEDASYLQKRGTVANEEKILITAAGVTLGDYGSGEKPVINSLADDYAIKAQEKNNVTIKNLKINADQAIACIYFLGANCENNSIENCELGGSDYGLRIIDGNSYTVKYNVFENEVDGIYSIADDAEIFYNIFKGNHKAINLSSYSSYAKIYNNVFYDNRQGISTSYAEVTLFNNIFYLTNAGDQAINHKLDKLVSNNNIFFPEQNGFLEINEVQYSSLDEYQQASGLDLSSFTMDPLFVDVYNNNFSVTEESRAIDAGRIVGLTQDFFGSAVPNGGGPDIGTVESATEGVPTSVNYLDDDGEKYLSVYPNPSSGRFNISFESKEEGQSDLVISSMTGKQVYRSSFDYVGVFVTEVDLTDFPRGMYYLSVKSADEVFTQKVVIN